MNFMRTVLDDGPERASWFAWLELADRDTFSFALIPSMLLNKSTPMLTMREAISGDTGKPLYCKMPRALSTTHAYIAAAAALLAQH
jgi:hypothetical protein